MLLIDHHEAEVGEVDIILQQRVCADKDDDFAFAQIPERIRCRCCEGVALVNSWMLM